MSSEEDSCQYSLHVANLHPDVDEAQLIEVFKQAGPISSIRVCRDAQTLKSLGYAYINFRAPAGAATALGELNYTLFKGQAVCLTFANSEAKEKDRPVEREGNIFVKGFDLDIDAPSLHRAFSEFGEVLSVKISQSEDGESLGYGFVQFKETKSATNAIELANGSILRGRMIRVAAFVPKKERNEENAGGGGGGGGGGGAGFKNVYVKNLPTNVREDSDLRVLFEDFGEILSAKVAQDVLGWPKGFGFVSFSSSEAAATAVAEMHDKEVDGSKLFVGEAQTKQQRQKALAERFSELRKEQVEASKDRNVYVKDLPASVTDEGLESLFESFGKISSAKVMVNEFGQSCGFGFVCFQDVQSATNCIHGMHGTRIPQGSKPLYVARFQTKEEREEKLREANERKRRPPRGWRRAAWRNPSPDDWQDWSAGEKRNGSSHNRGRMRWNASDEGGDDQPRSFMDCYGRESNQSKNKASTAPPVSNESDRIPGLPPGLNLPPGLKWNRNIQFTNSSRPKNGDAGDNSECQGVQSEQSLSPQNDTQKAKASPCQSENNNETSEGGSLEFPPGLRRPSKQDHKSVAHQNLDLPPGLSPPALRALKNVNNDPASPMSDVSSKVKDLLPASPSAHPSQSMGVQPDSKEGKKGNAMSEKGWVESEASGDRPDSLQNQIFVKVVGKQPDLLLARKITGMIMETNAEGVKEALDHPAILSKKIEDALWVLDDCGMLDKFVVAGR